MNTLVVRQLRTSALVLLVLTVLTGVVYPVSVTVAAQLMFPRQANGSLLIRDGRPVGSELIGQPFDDPRYFWGRLSATGTVPYDAAASSGSNYGPSNPALIQAAQARLDALTAAGHLPEGAVPVDLLTASGSGLDPHISVAAALYQARRVAAVRGLDAAAMEGLVARFTQGRQLGLLGEPRVNVLQLNLALDGVE